VFLSPSGGMKRRKGENRKKETFVCLQRKGIILEGEKKKIQRPPASTNCAAQRKKRREGKKNLERRRKKEKGSSVCCRITPCGLGPRKKKGEREKLRKKGGGTLPSSS